MKNQFVGRSGTMRRFLGSMAGYYPQMLLTLILEAARYGTGIFGSLVCAKMILSVLGFPSGVSLLTLLVLTGICACIRPLLYYGEMWFGHNVSYMIQRDTRIRLYDKLDKLGPSYLENNTSSNIGAAAMGDIEHLEWFIAHTFGNMIAAIVTTVTVSVILWNYHLSLGILSLAAAVLAYLVPNIHYRLADFQGEEMRRENAAANSVVLEGIQGARDLVALNSRNSYHEKCGAQFEKYYKAEQKFAKRMGREKGEELAANGYSAVMILGVLILLNQTQHLSAESALICFVLFVQMFTPIQELSVFFSDLGVLFAAANRIQSIFDAEPMVPDSGKSTLPDGNLDIVFQNVTFGYEKDSPPVLKNVGFQIPAGATVALVGPSGTGKTTCLNLLLRNWDVWSGGITVGGVDIRDLPLMQLETAVSAVLQDVFLFHTSVKENIRLGKPDATDEEVETAAKAAYAHDFIMGLPKGYDTVTGERGFCLSGGQRQRISIARAILRNAPILVLDEAVCSLDTENERLIQQALDAYAQNRTTLVIAHRLSTIVNADMVVVLKEGTAVQTGTHKELMGQEGFYRNLMNYQMVK